MTHSLRVLALVKILYLWVHTGHLSRHSLHCTRRRLDPADTRSRRQQCADHSWQASSGQWLYLKWIFNKTFSVIIPKFLTVQGCEKFNQAPLVWKTWTQSNEMRYNEVILVYNWNLWGCQKVDDREDTLSATNDLDHCSPDSMSGCSTGWAPCQWVGSSDRAPVPHCAGRTSPAGGLPSRSGCQRGSSGAGRCSGTSYSGSGSESACSPLLQTPQSVHSV